MGVSSWNYEFETRKFIGNHWKLNGNVTKIRKKDPVLAHIHTQICYFPSSTWFGNAEAFWTTPIMLFQKRVEYYKAAVSSCKGNLSELNRLRWLDRLSKKGQTFDSGVNGGWGLYRITNFAEPTCSVRLPAANPNYFGQKLTRARRRPCGGRHSLFNKFPNPAT